MAIQDYIDHALNALPVWFSDEPRTLETIRAFAVLFDRAQSQMEFWHDMTFVLNADADPGQPDWLQQHAIDRNLRRQDGESDGALRERIRGFASTLTLPAVLALVQDIVDAEGIVGTVAILELREAKAHFGDFTSDGGTGVVFTDGPEVDQVLLDLTGGPAGVPTLNQDKIVISGALSAANDGTFLIEGLLNNNFIITNAGGVFETDATAAWTWQKFDTSNNLIDGFAKAYFSRGHRMADTNAALVVILPFGCTAATVASVQQALLDNTGAGIQNIVECRANP